MLECALLCMTTSVPSNQHGESEAKEDGFPPHPSCSWPVICGCAGKAVIVLKEDGVVDSGLLQQQTTWHSDGFGQVVAGATMLLQCAQQGLTVLVDRKQLRIASGG